MQYHKTNFSGGRNMKQKLSGRAAAASLFVTFGLLLSACSGSGVDEAAAGDSAATTECGEWGIAMHAWVGYTASANVVSEIATKELGCTINQEVLGEADVTYDAMEAGSVDVVIEDWGGGRWSKYVDRGTIVEVGPNGQEGLIGMYVPKWMADEYPDITDSANLNKYAELFKTADSGGKGAWYEGPPGYTTIGEKMVAANKLDFKTINTGSEAALIDLFTDGQKNKKAVLGYWFTPQYFNAQVELARINFPANDWSDAGQASGLTDYPVTPLIKLATTKLMDSGSPFANLVKNFSWTNEDQNAVAADIQAGTDPAAAAQKWIAANPDKVKAWLG
jgi:glycine betaine/proline transport system substrate-binding protein